MIKRRNIIRKYLLNHVPNVMVCVSIINLPVFY